MSTEFYHVTIETLAPPVIEWTLRVSDAASAPVDTPPDVVAWALRTLWEAPGSALPDVISVGEIFDYTWPEEHGAEYVATIEVLEAHGFPLGADNVAYNDKVQKEGILGPSVAWARYRITVTDPRWLKGLELGAAWDSTAFV